MPTAEQIELLQAQVDSALLTRPEKPLAGSSAIVTGSTRLNGIGLAIAERLALDGASPIFIVGTKNSEELAPFAKARLERYGALVHALIGDVTQEQSCKDMIEGAYDLADGNVAILVNNAGTNRNQEVSEITADDWYFTMASKTLGALLMTKEWFRVRNEASLRGGRVVNIGSVIGLHGNFGQDVYSMANSGLIGLTKAQSRELGRRGISVNLIAPGFVEGTEMTLSMPKEQLDGIKIVSAVSELISPKDVANAVAFLVGPDGVKITGQVLTVDAGLESNYTALSQMHQAGYRRVPRFALNVIDGISAEEATLIRNHRLSKGGKG